MRGRQAVAMWRGRRCGKTLPHWDLINQHGGAKSGRERERSILKGRRRFSILQINFVNYNAFCTVFSAFTIPCRYSKWGMLCWRLRALQYLLPYRSSRLTTSICLVVNAFNSPDLKSFNLSTHQIKFDIKVPQSRYGLGATPTVFSGWSKL